MPMQHETLALCEERIGYRFRNRALLEQSLTHSSARTALSNEPGNERLEFLGDAVLGLVITEYLYAQLPLDREGELTRIKSAVVSRPSLAARFQALGLTAYIAIGKGLALKTRIPVSVLANVYEALVAAIYLDGGLAPARDFCLRSLGPLIGEVQANTALRNYKSLLQEIAQRRFNRAPVYRTTRVRGPEHARSFQMCAIIGDRRFRAAWAHTKKDAEQTAAAHALDELRAEFPTDTVFADWPPLPQPAAPPTSSAT